MADSNRDRNGRYGGRGRDFEWDRDRDFGRGPDWPDYGGGTRWGSGDYRQNFGRERGASGNYGGGGGFGSGGGYGTARDYETAHYADTGYDTPRQSYRGRGPKNFQRSDERLRELVSERLEEHHDVDASDIEVTVSNGEVTLTGTVADRRMKRLAEDVAAIVGGVKDVHNNLTIDPGFFSRMADAVRDVTHR